MEKPNLMESLEPRSGQYSLKTDLLLNAWLAVATVTYLAALLLLRRFPEWNPYLRGALVLAPFVPGLLYLRSGWRFIAGLDELQRRVQLEAVLFASLGTVLAVTAANALSAQGLELPGLHHGLGVVGTATVLFTLWLVGGAIVNRRYQ